MLTSGFKINESDKCIYSKYTSGKAVIICLYVDDMLIFGTNSKQVNKTKVAIMQVWNKDIGEANVILGIRINREQGQSLLS